MSSRAIAAHSTLTSYASAASTYAAAAVLISNGASTLCPYLYLAVGRPHGPVDKLLHGLEESLCRVMSKMGT